LQDLNCDYIPRCHQAFKGNILEICRSVRGSFSASFYNLLFLLGFVEPDPFGLAGTGYTKKAKVFFLIVETLKQARRYATTAAAGGGPW
jgi:hypothetical protein